MFTKEFYRKQRKRPVSAVDLAAGFLFLAALIYCVSRIVPLLIDVICRVL